MAAAKKSDFDKVLSAWDILVIAFGAMIGWGWVVSTGDWIMEGGVLGAMLGFVIGGIMVFFVGLTYAELTSAMPQCGGEHVFSYKAMGPLGSFVCTWMIVLGYVSVVCFEACALPTIVAYIYPDFLTGYMYTVAGFDIYASWLAVAIIVSIFITVINIVGTKTAAILQTILTVIIGGVGILLIAASALTGTVSNLEGQLFMGATTTDMVKGTLAVAVMTPFYFIGFDVIPQAAEEISVSLKKIGRILILSIVLAVLFYALIIGGVGYVMNNAEIAVAMKGVGGLVTADAMAVAFNSSIMAKVLIIGGLCGILTSWNSFLIGGSRAMYSMAESYMIPHVFAKLSKKYKTPITALLLIGLLSIIAPFFGKKMLVWVVDAGNFGCCVAYCMVAISFVILRKKAPDMPRPYKVSHYKLVGAMAILMSGFMVVMYVVPGSGATLVPQEWGMVLGWSILGVLFGIYCKAKYGSKFATHIDVAADNAAVEDAGDLAFGEAMAAALHDVESDAPVTYVSQPLSFSFSMPVSVVFGSGKASRAGELFAPYGKNAFIVTDAATAGKDVMKTIETSLHDAGITTTRFAHVTGKSLDVTEASALDAVKKNHSDFVIAVGGYDVTKCARSIAQAAGSLPLTCVPTTYRANACFDGGQAKVVIVDPACMTDMSQKERAVYGFAALCDCIGAYTAADAQPLTDAMALYAIDILNEKLEAVCSDTADKADKAAWEKVVLASIIGCMVHAETGCPVSKGLEKAAASLSRPADECLLAAVVPVVIDAKAGKDPFLYGKLARTMGGFTSDDCASRLVHLARALHLDIRLADMNVREDDIAKMAEAYIGEEEEDAAASVSLNPANELA
ncbi:MAG: iron-containing alcohol dehydrogenase [Megasphaera sp.]|uniref:amino acid permease n=1 Tax=Megasphaera sp. TaxID=2023260 RepID=UPI003F0D1968